MYGFSDHLNDMPCTRFSAERQGSSRYSTTMASYYTPVELIATSAARGIRRDADELLAQVLAAQQADEGLRRVLQALGDVLVILHAALAHPRAGVAQEVGETVAVVANDEALDLHAHADDDAEIRARRQLARAVLGDVAAERNARERVDLGQHGLEHVAADVVEVDVDALGALGLQCAEEIGRAIAHAGVEAELLDDIGALVGRAGHADRARALDPGHLADGRADRAGRGGHHHGLARLRRASESALRRSRNRRGSARPRGGSWATRDDWCQARWCPPGGIVGHGRSPCTRAGRPLRFGP